MPGVDADGNGRSVAAQRGFHRQILDFRVEIFLILPAVGVEMLLEIALVVEQADGDQRNAQAAGALDVIAREDAQATGIDRHGLVDAELQREVGHRLRAEHPGVGSAPRRDFADILLQSAVGLIDPAVEHQFGGPHLQPLRRELGEQGDGVMVELPPADRIEVSKEINDVGVPAPP